jgi:diguanylate cyclase (GGDEF)-like protein/PAS domain S-box-containing protein
VADEQARLRLFEFTVEYANDPVLITTTDLERPGPFIVYVNRAFTRMSGYTREEVIGQTPRILQGPGTSREEMQRLRAELEAKGSFVGETVNYAKDGREYFMEWSVYALRDERGCPRYYVAVQRDISERKKYEMRIEEQARDLAVANEQLAAANARLAELSLTDSLSGLWNRRALQQKMSEEVARARRYDFPLSLLLMDVDRFKGYNDSFGHPAGDAALQQIAQILRAHSRPSDVVARHGGEEFAILLPQTDRESALRAAEQHRAAVEAAPWPLRAVTISVGVATAEGPALNEDCDGAELTRRADEALYRSKNTGRNRVS